MEASPGSMRQAGRSCGEVPQMILTCTYGCGPQSYTFQLVRCPWPYNETYSEMIEVPKTLSPESLELDGCRAHTQTPTSERTLFSGWHSPLTWTPQERVNTDDNIEQNWTPHPPQCHHVPHSLSICSPQRPAAPAELFLDWIFLQLWKLPLCGYRGGKTNAKCH